MRRAVGIALVTLAALVVLLAVLLAVVIGTDSGTRFAIDRARSMLPAALDLGRVEGRLAGPLVVHDVVYQTDAMRVTLARAELDWRPRALLGRRLQIDRLALYGLRHRTLERAEPAEPSKPFELPERIDLPVAVQLDALSLSDAVVAAGDGSDGVVIDSVRLAGEFQDARLRLERIEVDAPLLDLRSQAPLTLAAHDDYPLDAELAWQLRVPELAPMDGFTGVSGTLRAVALDQRIGAPYNLLLEARVEEPLGELDLDARLQLTSTRLAAIRDDLPALQFDVDARAQGRLAGLNVTAAVDGIEFEGRAADAELTLGGELALTATPGADLRAEWHALQWPLDGAAQVESRSGTLAVRGSPDDYRAALDADFSVPDQVGGRIALDATGDAESMTASLRAALLDGELTGDVALAWAPALEGEVTLRAQGLDPGRVPGDWSAALRDRRLDVAVRARYADATAVVDQLRATFGGLELQAQGRLGEASAFDWQLASDDLSRAVDGVAGRIRGSGRVEGTLPQARYRIELEAAAVAFEDVGLEALELAADVDLAGARESELELTARGGRVGALTLESLALSGAGTPAAHVLELDLATDRGSAEVALEGSAQALFGDAPAWDFTLGQAQLGYPELAPWRLDDAVSGRLASGDMHIARHCWTSSGAARLCLEGARSNAGIDARFALESLAYAYFAPLLPEDFAISGQIAAQGRVSLPASAPPQGRLEVRSSGGEVVRSVPPPRDPSAAEVPRTLLAFEPSEIVATADEEGVDARAELRFAQGRIYLEAASPGPLEGDLGVRPIRATAHLDVPDLSFVAALVPDITQMRGRLDGELDVGGTLDQVEVAGRLALAQGGVQVATAGVTLDDVTMSIRGRDTDEILLEAHARSGGGDVRVDGTLSLADTAPTADIRIQGDAFQLLGTQEARLYASPDLTITAGAERVDVTGEVRIPRADITPPELPESAVSASDDVILLDEADEDGEAVAAASTERPLHAQVRVVLGDEVRFAGFGLQARFEGSVLATVQPDAPITATGDIDIVEGEYRAYGQGLVIDSGRIYFAGGPITEPALDIRAVRRPEEGIEVGAQVRGTLEQPEFTLFSDPPMTQQEQLSYLVLGRSLEESPGGESSALSQAALALGLRGGDFLARNLGERVGVDQFGIETGSGEAGAASDPSQAALVIGKYLSPKLYVSYGVGLFDPVTVLRMQYALTRRLELITESSSEATGGDLVYTLERGD